MIFPSKGGTVTRNNSSNIKSNIPRNSIDDPKVLRPARIKLGDFFSRFLCCTSFSHFSSSRSPSVSELWEIRQRVLKYFLWLLYASWNHTYDHLKVGRDRQFQVYSSYLSRESVKPMWKISMKEYQENCFYSLDDASNFRLQRTIPSSEYKGPTNVWYEYR